MGSSSSSPSQPRAEPAIKKKLTRKDNATSPSPSALGKKVGGENKSRDKPRKRKAIRGLLTNSSEDLLQTSNTFGRN